jgi:hypothetical protein
LESACNSYVSFVKELDVAQNKKDKLLKLGNYKDLECCAISFSNPMVSLARMQYIVSNASNQSEQIESINSIDLASYKSAFYMKRYSDFAIVDSDSKIIGSFVSKADLNLTTQEVLARAYQQTLPDNEDMIRRFSDNYCIDANIDRLCLKSNIYKEKVPMDIDPQIRSKLRLLSNVGYMIALSDKESNPLKDKDHMRDIDSNMAKYLHEIDFEDHHKIKDFLSQFTQNCIIKKILMV